MKLVFYSGGEYSDNISLDLEMLQMAPARPRVTFIPSCSYDHEFTEFSDHFHDLGISDIGLLAVDTEMTQSHFEEILKSDIVYLSGGNTYYFLEHLKRSGVLKLLKEYILKGGILAGLSAGAIIMTPNIHMAGIPDFDKDENDVNLTNLKSLGFVPFEFFPHYCNTKRYIHALNEYSLYSKFPILAFPDGAGLIVHGDRRTLLGKAWGFHRGKKFII